MAWPLLRMLARLQKSSLQRTPKVSLPAQEWCAMFFPRKFCYLDLHEYANMKYAYISIACQSAWQEAMRWS